LDIEQIEQAIKEITLEAVAENTVKSYGYDLKSFWAWAYITKDLRPTYPTPPELIEAYIVENIQGFDVSMDKLLLEFGYKSKPGRLAVATIRRRVDALIWAHKTRDLESPAASSRIQKLFKSARRLESKNGVVARKSDSITQDILTKLVKSIKPDTLIGKRNRAILTFGFYTGGRRRSEIAGAEYRFLTEHKGGFQYNLHRSKTDQEGEGRLKMLWRKRAYPLKAWIKAAKIKDGYLFRQIINGTVTARPIHPDLVNQIVKTHIEAIGLDPANYGAHGLRRGFVTTCARRGIPVFDIMAITDHKDLKMVQGYCDEVQSDKNKGTRL